MMKKSYTSIDEYIADFPPEVQAILQKIRKTIQSAAPEAVEAISYQMPTFKMDKNLIHFAAYKEHIGIYPMPSGIEKFNIELAPYQSAKGSARFPLDQAIPYDLVKKMTLYRVEELKISAANKNKK